MQSIVLTGLVFVLFTIVNVHSVDNSNLISLVVFHRHGARTPQGFYRNDPYYYNSTLISEGLGQITNEGKNQQYALGLWLRSQYNDWLPSSYNKSDIYVQSTDSDLTIMSGQCNLAGLYAPNGTQIWNSSVPNWQPVPIHTVPDQYDPVLKNNVPCNKWSALRDRVESAPYFSSIYTQYKEMFEYLSNKTGENITTLNDIKSLFDTLYVEHEQFHLELPEWTKEVYPDPMESLVKSYLSADTYNTTLARLKSGRLFHQIFRYFRDQATGVSEQPKFLMFSADEAILSRLLNSMSSAYSLERPTYASALIFELRRNTNDNTESYLNIFYRKDGVINNISANGCAFHCNLEDFKDDMKKIIVNQTNWEQECGDTDNLDTFDDYEYNEADDVNYTLSL